MSVINSQPLIGASGNQGGAYNIERSLRFRSSASAYLSRTNSSSPTSATTWTYSTWVKRGSLGATRPILNAYSSTTATSVIDFSSDNIRVLNIDPTGTQAGIVTNAVFRDPSAWYHIVVSSTASSTPKLYVNGVEVTSFSSSSAVTASWYFGSNSVAQWIGREQFGAGNDYFDGYLAEAHYIDGQALTPSSFGETDTITGVWKPKKYTGTYGTNGFYLKFNNLTSTSTLGNDSSGNSNTWTVNNVSLTTGATYDSMTDVPTLTSATAANYSTLNPISNIGNGTISNANLNFVSTTAAWRSAAGTIFSNSGKFYFEGTLTAFSGANPSFMLGVCNTSFSSFGSYSGSSANAWVVQGSLTTTNKWNSDTSSLLAAQTSAVSDVFMVAVDTDAAKVWFGRNGTWYASGDPAAGTNAAYTTISGQLGAVVSSVDTVSTIAVNFGQRPFAYTPPSGFVALNTFNLPTSTIVAGNTNFEAKTWIEGVDGGSQVVNFAPDFVWLKNRANTEDHFLLDTIRTGTKYLSSNTTGAEGTISGTSVVTFNSNGITTGSTTLTGNTSYVGWFAKAGGASSSNTSGSITSTVSVNASAGFSIVTYTGNGTSGATVGHGLGVAPSVIFLKQRDSAVSWRTYHISVGNIGGLVLNSDTGTVTDSSYWNNTTPSSTVFTIGNNAFVNTNGGTYVAYCWSEIAGFSKFSSYTGNGSNDGPFIYTGFRPKFVLIKSTANTSNWYIWDTARNTFNVMNFSLYPNGSNAEVTASDLSLDCLSNGFKIRGNSSGINTSSQAYTYMAFAENSLKNSLAR
jgi:hypothetical protein